MLNLLAEDVKWNVPGRTPLSGRRRGRDQVREFFSTLDRLVLMDRFDATSFVSQGDKVVVLRSERSTVRETGQHVEQHWAQVYTVREGRISRLDIYEDTAALAAAFGESAAERRAALGPMGVTEPPFSGGSEVP